MPRPTNKEELTAAAQGGYEKLVSFIEALTPEQRIADFDFEDRDHNVRDVLAHLTQWHRMMKRWYDEGMAGIQPKMPEEGYTWQTTAVLNQVIWERTQDVPLDQAQSELASTFDEMMNIIGSHTNEELFTKKYYKWTGTTSLGAYLVSATSSHYDWAMTKLKKALKTWKTTLG
ncbi:MAG: ClbS/DfsB family four-helix bundle protein [Propionibacteriaceae bacterium]|jgi:hypothetical protein|nr:ClbS/DfsB family four-helix bundle protein [Propionibacteriaceae bacterium]